MPDAAALPLTPETPPVVLDRTPELVAALRVERKLIDDLIGVLRRQRAAVAEDDIGAIDDSVFAAQRILLTLAQARQRRRSLLHVMTGREEVGLAEFEGVLGPAATPTVLATRDELRASAETLGRELQTNRRILSGAIDAGDRLLRALTGRSTQSPSYQPPSAPEDERGAGSGFLIDTQV